MILRAASRSASASHWMRRPSPMLAPIGIRGSSDAYGSWKMICIRRRIGFSLPLDSAVMSVPSKTIRPAVGSMSRRSARPTVDLPQPDSPTSPSVSPRRMLKRDVVDGLDVADLAVEDAPESGK